MAAKRFRRERKLYQLNFEAEEMDGFECIMTGVSLKKFIEISALASALEDPEGRTQENIARQYTTLAECLVSWNLDDEDGHPVPCDYDGLSDQDFDFVMAIMLGWMKAISQVSVPLDSGSSSGGTSPEESLGLASLSRSRAS